MLDPLVHGIVGNPQILGYLTDRKPAVSYIDLVLVLGFHGSEPMPCQLVPLSQSLLH